MLKWLHRIELLFGILLACCLVTAVGCKDSTDQAANTPAANQPEKTQPADASKTTPPLLDPGAVNSDGQVVLEGETVVQPDPNLEPVIDLANSGGEPATRDAATAPTPAEPEPTTTPEIETGDASEPTPDIALEMPLTNSNASDKDAPATDTTPKPITGDNALPLTQRAPSSQLPVEANVVTEAERNQVIAADWPEPQAVLFVSGQQHGYIEPCGCTGLDNQKGGLIRRDTLLTSLRDRGWNLVPVDVGNQVRRTGRQPLLKFQSTVDAFKLMDYRAATLGIDDLQLSAMDLILNAGSDGQNQLPFISANVIVFDESFFPKYRIVESGGRKIGITGILGNEYKPKIQSEDIIVSDPIEQLKPVVTELKEKGCDFLVLLAHASTEESAAIAGKVDGFDLVVTAGGFGEPTLHPEPIENSSAVMVQVGTKGMYGGIIGLFDDAEQPIRYQKIAISSQFTDSKRMLAEFANYQERLRSIGLKELGATPLSHPTGRTYVGSAVCGDCHTTAYEVWENSPHVHATESIIAADNDRGGIARNHDPECISCHVTGWAPQDFHPYTSGFESVKLTDHLTGSGCENCHGPGSAHVAAEQGDVDATTEELIEFQQQMVLKLADAQAKCLSCHDLDNSPAFHQPGAFETFWEQVKHVGKD